MARTYKRDKNGKFASTGGGASGASSRGKSLRQTVAAKRGVESTKQAAVRSTKYGGPKPFADQQTASRSINRSMSKAANTRIASTSVPMSKSASKAVGAQWQKDAATLKANKARRIAKKK